MTSESKGDPGSTLAACERLVAACDRYEADWRAGRAPRVDDYVAGVPEPDRDALRAELLALEAELCCASGSWLAAGEAVEMPEGREPPGAEATAADEKKHLGRYRDLGEIGRGGMGAVHRVRDLVLHRDLALKVVAHRSRGDEAEAEAERRFVEEAQVVGQLQHPGIPPLHEMGRLPDGRPYFTMKLIKGRTLRDLLKERPTPGTEVAQFVAVFEQIAQTMAYAHSKRVLHRDLKPSNVMVGAFGEVQVMDWGLVKVLKPGAAEGEGRDASPAAAETGLSVIRTVRAEVPAADTQAGSLLGTPDYIAPEQARGELDDIDERSDVFGLGAILCEVLSGRPPYVGRSSDEIRCKAARADLADALARLEGCGADTELIDLARACLAPKPLDRPRDAARVAEAVSAYRAGVAERLRRAELARVEEQARAEQERQARRLTAARVAGVAVALAVAALSAGVALGIHHRRLAALRSEVQKLVLRGQAASSNQDYPAAKLCLTGALAKIGAESSLADLRSHADHFLARVDRQLADGEASRIAREKYERFLRRCDDAWFHGTLLTGLSPADDPEATQAACREALLLFGVDADSTAAPALEISHLDSRSRAEITIGCYELLLLLAEVEATRRPDQFADDGRARRAIRILDFAAKLGPRTQAYHLRRAAYLTRIGDSRAAGQERERAAALKPTGAVDHFLVGDLWYKRGDLDRAILHFEEALFGQPDHYWAQYFLAGCYLRLRRPSEAKACLTACLSRRPGFVWPYVYRGFAHGELGAFEAAEADFRRALELDPDDDARYSVYVNRGVIRLLQGRLEGAIASLEDAIALKPHQYQAHLDLAQAFQQQQRWDEAAEQFGVAVRLAPGLAPIYRARAQFNLECHDPDLALRDFEEAIRLSPPEGATWALAGDHTARARILLQHPAKRYQEAMDACDAALAVCPEFATALHVRAEALLTLGRHEEAARTLDRYLEKGTPTAGVFRTRGAIRAKCGDYPGAVEDDTRALGIEADSGTYCHRGWAYVFCEAWKLAIKDFERAIRLDPHNGDAYNGLGYSSIKIGKAVKAVENAEEALRRQPHDMEMMFNIACIFALAAGEAEAGDDRRDHQALATKYRDRALEVLRQTLDRLPDAQRPPFWRDRVLSDPDLGPIRHCPAFTELEAKYSEPGK